MTPLHLQLHGPDGALRSEDVHHRPKSGGDGSALFSRENNLSQAKHEAPKKRSEAHL